MRNLDNNLHYPEDIVDEVHGDARIIAGAMWHTREIMGSGYCDSLFHFAKYLHARDFCSYFLDILLTDDDDGDLTNGSPHYSAIYKQFGRHGIGLGDAPHFWIRSIEIGDNNEGGAEGNNNGLWEPGETVGIRVEIFRAGNVDPPSDGEVIINLETDNRNIELVRPEVSLGEVDVGDMADTPQPLLFRIDDDAPVEFADLYITVSADPEEQPVTDTLHITVGRPPVLLVKDGTEGRDHTKWYRESLDELDLVYAEYDAAMEAADLADQLSLFDAVIWFTGDDYEGILSEDDRDGLAEYLDRGGNLILTGQSAGTVPDAEPFFNDYLGSRNVIDSLRQREVFGVQGDFIGHGLQLLLIGQSARNQVRPGAVEAIEPGVEVYYWPRVEGQPAAGVRYENPESGARSVYLAFGLEAVYGAQNFASRAAAIEPIMRWFGILEASQEVRLQPAEFQLNAPYPNPFNTFARIDYSLPGPSWVKMVVFDIRGRTIYKGYNEHHAIGTYSFTWDGSDKPSGVYILQLTSGKAGSIMPVFTGETTLQLIK